MHVCNNYEIVFDWEKASIMDNMWINYEATPKNIYETNNIISYDILSNNITLY